MMTTHREHINEEVENECLLIYVFIQHTNSKTMKQ